MGSAGGGDVGREGDGGGHREDGKGGAVSCLARLGS